MGNLSVLVKKFSVPVLFFVFGITLLVIGIRSKQDSMFMMASVLMFTAGLLSVLYSTGKIKPRVLYILGFIAGAAALVTVFLSYKSVRDTAIYNENYAQCKSEAIQNLTDIRFAQKAYAEKHGTYANTWEELVEFIKTGTVPYVVSEGIVPARKLTVEESKYIYKDNRPIDNLMTEVEAYKLSKSTMVPEDLEGFRRDTIEVSLLKTKFLNKSYTDSRMKAGFGKFYADSLPYIPFTKGKEKWKLETKDSVQMGDDYYPAIRVSGEIPYSKIQGTANEKLSFGKLTSNETAGSWEDE